MKTLPPPPDSSNVRLARRPSTTTRFYLARKTQAYMSTSRDRYTCCTPRSNGGSCTSDLSTSCKDIASTTRMSTTPRWRTTLPRRGTRWGVTSPFCLCEEMLGRRKRFRPVNHIDTSCFKREFCLLCSIRKCIRWQ